MVAVVVVVVYRSHCGYLSSTMAAYGRPRSDSRDSIGGGVFVVYEHQGGVKRRWDEYARISLLPTVYPTLSSSFTRTSATSPSSHLPFVTER